jgi:tellurite resistance protein TehA-like permease
MERAEVSPGAFAFVMATGIIAHDARVAALLPVAEALVAIALVGYVLLTILNVWRLVHRPRRVVDELSDPGTAPGFLTVVSATCVVGAVLAPVAIRVAAWLWVLGAALGLGFTYTLLVAVATNQHKRGSMAGLSGSWLLVVVAAQSVAFLATLTAAQFGSGATLVLLVALIAFSSACVLYLFLMPPIVHRLEFVSLAPREFTPDHWIDMGAMAISALTGSALLSVAADWGFLRELSSFIAGLTVLFWAGAIWWIPLLVLLEGWRHVVRRVPLVYGTEYWSMVFPIGMYAAATFAVADVLNLAALLVAAQWLTYLALAIWLVVAAGMVRRVLHATYRLPPHHADRIGAHRSGAH